MPLLRSSCARSVLALGALASGLSAQRAGVLRHTPVPAEVLTFRSAITTWTTYEVASVVALGSNLGTLALNVVRTNISGDATGFVGVGGGAFGMAMGVGAWHDGGARGHIAHLDFYTGVASLVAGVAELATDDGWLSRRVSAAPWLGTRGQMGLAVRVTP